MNFDKKLNSIFKKSKLNIFSRGTYVSKHPQTGAPLSAQRKWKLFPQNHKRILRQKYKDSDGDGVPDRWDCNKYNPLKQGWAHRGKTFNREETTHVKMMSPDKFLRTTKKEMEGRGSYESMEDYKKSIFQEGSQENIQKLKKVIQQPKGKMEVPFLLYDEQGRPTGHEGRHRAQAAKELGAKLIPVTIGRKLKPSNYRDWKSRRERLGSKKDWKLELENEEKVTSSISADIPIKEQREYGVEKPEVLSYPVLGGALQKKHKIISKLVPAEYNDKININKFSTKGGELEITEYENNIGAVSKLYVDEDSRRKGIATSLLNEAKDKYSSVHAQVSNIPSVKTHFKAGFRFDDNTNLSEEDTIKEFEKASRSPGSIGMVYKKGASPQKQQEWHNKPQQEKIAERIIEPNADYEGEIFNDKTIVPDKGDCQPMNPDEQDSIPIVKVKRRRNLSKYDYYNPTTRKIEIRGSVEPFKHKKNIKKVALGLREALFDRASSGSFIDSPYSTPSSVFIVKKDDGSFEAKTKANKIWNKYIIRKKGEVFKEPFEFSYKHKNKLHRLYYNKSYDDIDFEEDREEFDIPKDKRDEEYYIKIKERMDRERPLRKKEYPKTSIENKKRREEVYNDLTVEQQEDVKKLMEFSLKGGNIQERRPDLTGAPIQKQQEWKEMNEFEKDTHRIMEPDSDGDGVVDDNDCNRYNPDEQDEPIGKAKLKCTICGKIYPSYIVSSGDWNRLPSQYRKKEICLECYKKITHHKPTVLLKMGGSVENIKGASLQVQQDWRNKTKIERSIQRVLSIDSDRDGVPDKWDCYPWNALRQDTKPNRLMKERIDKLPIYYIDNEKGGDTPNEQFDYTFKGSENVESWRKYGNAQRIGDKGFPKKKSREVYDMIKKHPHLISEIEKRGSNIIYAKRIEGEDMSGWNSPILNEEDKKITGSTIVSLDEDKRTNMSKDEDAGVLFHELEHSKQYKGQPYDNYAKEKGYSDIDLKGYFNNPSEVGAREAQFSKLGERLGDKGEQAFRNMEESRQKSHLEQQDKAAKLGEEQNKIEEEYRKERTEAAQQEYDIYKEEEKLNKVDIDENITEGLKALE